MLIDWFTVLAQIVNFLILVALMKRFLYGPLIRAIDARENAIAAAVDEADQKNRAAAAHMAQVETQREELEASRARVIAEAREEADRQRGEMLQKARASVRALDTRWRDEMAHEKLIFLDEMRNRAAAGILAVTRQALAGLASAELECSAIQAFLGQLQKLDPSALRLLCARDPVVATPAELPETTQTQIRDAIENRLGNPVPLRFESVPAISWGIELRGGGQRIGWTPESYLDTLEANMKDALDRAATADYSAAA